MSPIRKSISIADPTDLILSRTESSRVCHGILYTAIDMATMTADATIRATWLPPARESAPNTLMTATRTAMRTMNGIIETSHEGLFCSFMRIIFCCLLIALEMRSRASDTPASSTFLFLNGILTMLLSSICETWAEQLPQKTARK